MPLTFYAASSYCVIERFGYFLVFHSINYRTHQKVTKTLNKVINSSMKHKMSMAYVRIYRHTSQSAQCDLLCIHCAMCVVILTCTLRTDSSLRAKPCPVRTCSQFHIVQTLFRRRTKGAICSENMV